MLADLTKKEMEDYAVANGMPAFRGRQIFDAIYSAQSIDEVSVLSKNLKEKLRQDYPEYKILRKFISKDGTIKYVFSFPDGNIVEGVFMKYKYGNTLCLSTQVGCRMGCKFCASTLKGLIRNLSAGEMLGQVLLVNRDNGGTVKDRKVTNLVLMGSGEPLDNYAEVTKFLRLVSSADGINISQRNISLSTCGLVPKIYSLADDGFSVTLTISLHASNDEMRRVSMPVANSYKIEEIVKACKYYFEKTGRRIVFEYTLLKGVNDNLENAKELGKILKGFPCHVNIIPLNEVKERNLKATTRAECYAFSKALEKEGISSTVRRTLGEDIGGACGQLRNQILKGEV